MMCSDCFKEIYHDTLLYQLYAQHKGVLVNIVWGDVVSDHGAATA